MTTIKNVPPEFNPASWPDWFSLVYQIVTAHDYAIVGISLMVILFTEVGKRYVRNRFKRYRQSAAFINIDAMVIAAITGTAFAYPLWPMTAKPPWFIIGAGTGVVLILLHAFGTVFIRWKWPGLAAMMSGNRRQRSASENPGRRSSDGSRASK